MSFGSTNNDDFIREDEFKSRMKSLSISKEFILVNSLDWLGSSKPSYE